MSSYLALGCRQKSNGGTVDGMNEVYTISGPPVDEVEVLGAVSALDQQCAQKVKVLVVAGGASVIGGVGVGLFGTYKLLKGRGAAGAVGLLGAVALWVAGGALMRTAALGFQKCRTP